VSSADFSKFKGLNNLTCGTAGPAAPHTFQSLQGLSVQHAGSQGVRLQLAAATDGTLTLS